MKNLPRLMIAAPGSGSGKTTVTLALLAALIERGMKISSFKCGPDYIDPIFHRELLGIPGYNLDLFFSTPGEIRGLLCKGAANKDLSVIEGVMGYYDGTGSSDLASSWQIAVETLSPVILVVSVKGSSLTACAVIKGIMDFRQNSMINGVILNNCGSGLYQMLAPIIEHECGVKVFGYLPPTPEAVLESRYLGLDIYQSRESNFKKIELLKKQAEKSLDIDGLIKLADNAPTLVAPVSKEEAAISSTVNIAVAKDKTFQFYYAENLELLSQLGANLVYFSPLQDRVIPHDCSALYIGGGYPELFAEQLNQNHSMLQSIRTAVTQGMPTIAECGGFMYLQQSIEGTDGKVYPMAGALEGHCEKKDKLSRFGYINLTALGHSMLAETGESIKAHEYHYWDSTTPGSSFLAKKPSGAKQWYCAEASRTMYAGFPHLYLQSSPIFARRFVQAAEEYSKNTLAEGGL